jgi:hypothetical protein
MLRHVRALELRALVEILHVAKEGGQSKKERKTDRPWASEGGDKLEVHKTYSEFPPVASQKYLHSVLLLHRQSGRAQARQLQDTKGAPLRPRHEGRKNHNTKLHDAFKNLSYIYFSVVPISAINPVHACITIPGHTCCTFYM